MDAAPFPAPTRPPLKWPGGKYDIAPQIIPLLPDPARVTGTFREPFAGGAALTFRWAAPAGLRCALSDTEAGLIDTYLAVRDGVEDLIATAQGLALPAEAPPAAHEAHYYELRDRYNDTPGLVGLERAALFLYLHRACFNGLHRVDRRGRFNASYGDLTGPPRFHEEKLRAAAAALQGATVERLDFEPAASRAGPGDLVYFDSPYDGTWVGYQAGGFASTGGSDACQIGLFTRQEERPALLRLRDVCAEFDRRGIRWAASNADTPEVRRLFGGWDVTPVTGRSSISRDPASRGARPELLIRNFSERR
jgi:DNA adenine methylase